MRRAFISSSLIVLISSLASAVGNNSMSGCGLGYLLLSNHNDSKLAQVLGVTTNNTYSNQTFGITSGTSGCTEDGAVKLVRQTEVYVEVNFDSLRREMAVGQGEFVDTLTTLLGATDATRPALLKLFRSEYTALFPTANTTPEEMLHRLRIKLADHQELLG